VDKKIARLDQELAKYRDQMKKMRDGPSKVFFVQLFTQVHCCVQACAFFHVFCFKMVDHI